MGNIKGLEDITVKKVGIFFVFRSRMIERVVEVSNTRGRPKGRKTRVYSVTAPGEKERTGRYTLSPAALEQRRENVENNSLPVAISPERIARNAVRIQHVISVREIATRADHKDLLSLKSCFLEYLKLCQADGCSVGNLAAYAAMGFDNSGWNQWIMRGDEERKEFARFVKSTCAQFREGLISDGDLNPVIGIFWQRNFDGLRNDTEQVQAINDQEDLSGESGGYRKRYGNLIGMESDEK